jgi:hypothetical protein
MFVEYLIHFEDSMFKRRIFLNMFEDSSFSFTIFFLFEKINLKNFNIYTNHIISVEAANVLDGT